MKVGTTTASATSHGLKIRGLAVATGAEMAVNPALIGRAANGWRLESVG
jgi:hypothetical protein